MNSYTQRNLSRGHDMGWSAAQPPTRALAQRRGGDTAPRLPPSCRLSVCPPLLQQAAWPPAQLPTGHKPPLFPPLLARSLATAEFSQQPSPLRGWLPPPRPLASLLACVLACSLAKCLSSDWLMVRWLSLGPNTAIDLRVSSRKYALASLNPVATWL